MANQSPGPAFYKVSRKFKGRCPPILMKGRHSLPTDYTDVQLYDLPTTLGRGPKVTLHGRPEVRPAIETPGPSYIPPAFGSGARRSGIAPPLSSLFPAAKVRTGGEGASTSLGRARNPNETLGPGPGARMLRDQSFDATGRVGFTIKGQHDFQYETSESPGPGRYAPNFRAVMPSAPRIAFHHRTPIKAAPETPGYKDLGTTLGQGPKYTMKARASDEISII
jgi:hypothetical protein